MNPNSHNGGERAPASLEGAEQYYGAGETDSLNNEKSAETKPVAQPESQTQIAAPPVNIPTASTPVLPVDDDNQQGATVDNTSVHQPDRIDKQVLERAKLILQQTNDDPHERKSEMSKFKAQYIQKRFNKKIKVDT